MENGKLAEAIRLAVSGDREAIGMAIECFMPLINSRSIINKRIDEDLRQHIIMYTLVRIPRFVQR